MKYALGNMLNGAGGLNADGLALDLQFAADKTLTARRGPTPVFTRGSSATFVGSNGLIQSAGNNVARFDHDPVTLACKGLLIEESRTNSILQSGNIAASPWLNFAGSTVTANTHVAPDGTTTATTIVLSGLAQRYQPLAVTAGKYIFSIYARCASGTGNFRLKMTVGIIDTFSSDFTVTTSWQRFSFEINPSATTLNFSIHNGSDGASRTIIAWGAQIEAGSFATSYIPTTTGTAARAADVCTITGDAFNSFYNQSEGSLFSDVSSSSGTLVRSVTANGSTAAEQVAIGLDVTRVRAGSVDIGSFYLNAQVLGKRVVAYASGQQAASRLGGVVSSTNAGLPSGISSLFIGGRLNFTSTVTISAIRYYRKRLPNAKLVSLTT